MVRVRHPSSMWGRSTIVFHESYGVGYSIVSSSDILSGEFVGEEGGVGDVTVFKYVLLRCICILSACIYSSICVMDGDFMNINPTDAMLMLGNLC